VTAPRFYAKDVPVEHYFGIRWPLAVWGAVLTQAIDDVLHGPRLAEVKGMSQAEADAFRWQIREAAEEWIADETNEPRRFVWVCDVLGFDPDVVRRSIDARRGN